MFFWTEKLYRYFIIDHNRPKLIQTKTIQYKPIKKSDRKKMMFSLVEVEQIIFLFQQRNQKINKNPKINRKNQKYPKISVEKITTSGVRKLKLNLAIGGCSIISASFHRRP